MYKGVPGGARRIIIRHRACAQACKGVLVMLREFTIGAFGFGDLVTLGGRNAGHPRYFQLHILLPRREIFSLRREIFAPREITIVPSVKLSPKNKYFLSRSTKN